MEAEVSPFFYFIRIALGDAKEEIDKYKQKEK